MQSGSIAKRYARALVELARDSGRVEGVFKEIENFEEYMRESPQLKAVLVNPLFPAHQRLAVLKDLLKVLKYSELTGRFLLFVAEKRRMDLFSSILREFRNYYDELNGLVRVTVTTAAPLTPELELRLLEQIEKVVNRKIVLTRIVDPDIIGGIVTRVGGMLIDGSVQTQLARMKSILLNEQLS